MYGRKEGVCECWLTCLARDGGWEVSGLGMEQGDGGRVWDEGQFFLLW